MTSDLKNLIATSSEKEPEPVRYRMQCPECGSTWERSRDCKFVEQTRQGVRFCARCEESLILTKDAKSIHPEFVAQIIPELNLDQNVTIGVDEYGTHHGDVAEKEQFDDGYYVLVVGDIVQKEHPSPPDWVNVLVSETEDGWQAEITIEVTVHDGNGKFLEKYETDATLTELCPTS
ncbi:type II toxin-antitoxin system MqsA family antitoxin [Haloprofundus salinisoli]|uniref:type II toxin-antitoxin system MqsA family antitoxin n=1 Tax=Haloprofundus salinisoli TaxID=2876193 RepID=UPI001CD01259|nr:type II toxin-antitoxin system MqsA family antitoxin [Haloprofundus salinisoli]